MGFFYGSSFYNNCLFLFSVLSHSASWSYLEDGEELLEQKDDSLPGNRLASAMTSDASAAAAALAACSDAQRGMDNMGRYILLTLLRALLVINWENLISHQSNFSLFNAELIMAIQNRS